MISTTLPPFDTDAWLPMVPASSSTNNNLQNRRKHPVVEDALTWCLTQHELHHGAMPGSGGRNSWLTALSLFCNEKGVVETDLLQYAIRWQAEDFLEQEIQYTIRGIYSRHAAQHAKDPFNRQISRDFLKTEAKTLENASETLLPSTIPTQAYDALPVWLRKCCEQFNPGTEQDVMLLSALGVLSGCFPSVKGIYDGAPVWLNLFVFVLAPAASGKSGLSWARKLAWPWHQQLTATSRLASDTYQLQLQEWKVRRKGKHAPAETLPPPPAFKQLYLPANTTASALMRALADNDGRGIICETEADTLSGALGQDFGNFSDLLRKAFHHEPASLMRKTDREQIDIAAPAISLALTGTPAQLRRLIPTAEDGLFSRFLFYTFKIPAEWRDVGPAGGRSNLGPFFDQQAVAVSRMMQEVAGHEIIFELTSTGWAELNAAGREGLTEAVSIAGEDGASSAFRLGLTTFRIAGILALLRCFEHGEAPGIRIVANEQDLQAAIHIVRACRTHALYLLRTLPAERDTTSKLGRSAQTKAENQARALELKQQGMSIRAIGIELGVAKSTIEDWLVPS